MKIYNICKSMPFYAVHKGFIPGIYTSWPECQSQVTNFKGARYKKFPSEEAAQEFVRNGGSSVLEKSLSTNTAANESIRSGAFAINKPAQTYDRKSKPLAAVDSFTVLSRNELKNSGETYDCKTLAVACESYTTISNELNNSLKQIPTDMLSLSKISALRTTLRSIVTLANATQQLVQQADQQLDNLERNHFNAKRRKLDSPNLSDCYKIGAINTHSIKSDGLDIHSLRRTSNGSTANVWTDGCCHNNGRDDALKKAGIGVYWGENDPRNIAEPLTGRVTNNRAEILAAARAIEQAKSQNYDNIVINTDSSFLINCMTKWIRKWQTNGWKVSHGEDVINREELEHLDNLMKDINVKWVHVKGHSGDIGNEAADKLANEGANKTENIFTSH